MGLILGGKFLWWKFSGGELSGGNHPGGNFPGESFPSTKCCKFVLKQSKHQNCMVVVALLLSLKKHGNTAQHVNIPVQSFKKRSVTLLEFVLTLHKK